MIRATVPESEDVGVFVNDIAETSNEMFGAVWSDKSPATEVNPYSVSTTPNMYSSSSASRQLHPRRVVVFSSLPVILCKPEPGIDIVGNSSE